MENIYSDEFRSLLLCEIMRIESLHLNIKFVVRKGKEPLYRNLVEMDDHLLACTIVTDSCRSIFKNSTNPNFQKTLTDLLNVDKSTSFEQVLGYHLLAQADNNICINSNVAKKPDEN